MVWHTFQCSSFDHKKFDNVCVWHKMVTWCTCQSLKDLPFLLRSLSALTFYQSRCFDCAKQKCLTLCSTFKSWSTFAVGDCEIDTVVVTADAIEVIRSLLFNQFFVPVIKIVRTYHSPLGMFAQIRFGRADEQTFCVMRCCLRGERTLTKLAVECLQHNDDL